MQSRLAPIIIGFVLLALMVVGSVWLNEQQDDSLRWVRHTLEVENRLASVYSGLQDEETSQRGYLLTGQAAYLDPSRTAAQRLGGDLDTLGGMTSDNPRQQHALATLRPLIAARQDQIRRSIELYRARITPAAIAHERLADGRNTMDQIRAAIGGMRAEEERLLHDRQRQADRLALAVRVGRVIDGLLILGLAAYTFNDARERLRASERDAEALRLANAKLQAEADARRNAESQVRQLQKMESLGQLTGGIAHDFNNVLAIVMGSLELAKRRFTSDPRRAEGSIDIAMKGARRAATLTARLLAFSRQTALEPRMLDINSLVGSMSEMLRHTIGEQVRIETVLSGGLWRTFVDPGQLETALLNLAVNARDAMPEGGKLTIETTNTHLDDAYAAAHDEVTAGQYVMTSVSDTGAGMPEEVIARAFDPFYTTKSIGKGTGLGLSQVYGFVKQSGGHVKIYSEPAQGTTIKLYLPRYFGSQADADQATPVFRDALPRAVPGEIVLVVEDEDQVRRVSVDILRDLGYTVIHAGGAAEALAALAQQTHVDLLFTDIVMPETNGRVLADLASQTHPTLKVLYTTGYTRNAVVHNGVVDVDVALIPKPYTVGQLAGKVRQVLDR
jgi:signal transduction histidine kinase/CheY-like chemotaxis protein